MKSCPTCLRTYADELTLCPLDDTPLQSNADPLVGQVFGGQYEIEALIAQTRTGQLYRARHSLLGDRVALKLFSPELRGEIDEWLRGFQHKWHDALRFRHSNAVAIYELRAEYMVMEYAEGLTLDKELQRRGRLTPGEVYEVLEPVARALDAARESGLACDFLTPADILIGRAEDNLRHVRLLPLIFNQLSIYDRLGATSAGVGLDRQVIAAFYAAPELWLDSAPPAGNRHLVYSLGVISYELASGQKPYDGSTLGEVVHKHSTGRRAPLWELAPVMLPSVARVIERALAKEATSRPANAGEFVAELRDALGMNLGAMESLSKMASAAEQIPDAAQISEKKRLRELEIERELRKSESSSKRLRRLEIELESLRSASSSKEATVTEKPLYTDENVQFTVYQPEAIAPARWYTLLAFAHLSKRRPDAPPDEPEPLAEVKRLAERVLADERADYDAVKQNSLYAVPHKGEITFVPEIAGCEFNPPSLTFSWQKSVHKVEFEMRAAASLDGQTARGRLTVFLGSLILADVPLSIRVDNAASAWSAREVPTAPVSASPYRKIFPSYSHKDRAIVEQIEHHVHSLGDKYLRDVTELRAGQDWQRWMREAIEEADMFQLFWSHNSMRSVYVRQEWEYALSLGRPNFIRPTYWEEPLPESPADNLPPQELRQLHFQHLRAHSGTDRTTPTATGNSQPPTERGVPTERGGRGQASGSTQSGRTVVCSSCGAPASPEWAFCLNCGAALSIAQQPSGQQAAGQSPPQPVTTHTSQLGSAPKISSEMLEREIIPDLSGSHWPDTSTLSPDGGGGRMWLWIGLVVFVVLLVGIYLLSRFL